MIANISTYAETPVISKSIPVAIATPVEKVYIPEAIPLCKFCWQAVDVSVDHEKCRRILDLHQKLADGGFCRRS